MKRKMIVLSLAVVLLLALIGVSSAQGPPGSGYWFGATHQNVGAADANVVITAYDSTSTSTFDYTPAALAPGASLNVGPNDIPGLPSGFVGSIVTSSDQPLVALVNLTNRQAGGFGVSGGKAAAIYSGVDGANANTNLSYPLAKHSHFNKTTTFYLQNAGSADTTVDVTFSFGGTDYPYTTPSISPGQMVAVDPGLAGVPSGNGNVGAMSMTAGQPIAGAMLEHEHTASVGTVLQGSSGFAPAELAQTVYCPSVKKSHFGRTSGVQVQNNHSVAQDIDITYVGVNTASSFTSSATNVAPGASVTFINDSVITSGSLFSAVVAGDLGPVAAIVNESELPLVSANQTSTTYNCQAAGTNSLSYPAYKEVRFGRTTALQIQNIGAADATNVVLSFTTSGGTFTTNAQTVAAGASKVYVCVSANAGLWSGSALGGATLSGVTVTADQPIIAIANEASWTSASPCTPDNGGTSFDKATSNAFNLN